MTTPILPPPSAPPWPHCADGAGAAGCRGRTVEPHDVCLAHLDAADRATHLAGVTAGADVDHRGTAFSASLLHELLQAGGFRHEQPRIGAARFDEANFIDRAGFTDVTFGGKAVFSGAVFGGQAKFDRAVFAAEATFSRATFADIVNFRWAVFNGQVRFGAAAFTGTARFNDTQFSRFAQFGGARFARAARFEHATFSDARFGGVSFTSSARFGGANFAGPARFGAVQFDGSAYFNGAVFADARFAGATFARSARFDTAAFTSANFEEASFNGDTRFDEAQFHHRSVFTGAAFTGHARFDRTMFAGLAEFDRAAFRTGPAGGGVTFSGAIFKGDAGFVGAVFQSEPLMGPLTCWATLDLSGAEFAVAVTIEAAVNYIRCVRTRWQSTATLRLRHASVDLTDAVLSSPIAVIAHPAPFTTPTGAVLDERGLTTPGVRVASVGGVDAAHLVVTNAALTECMFSGAFHLDQIRFEGDCAFARTPTGIHRWHRIWPYRWTRRRTLAEEQHWRAQATGQPAPAPGQRPSPDNGATVPTLTLRS